jgi:hypothetical protein
MTIANKFLTGSIALVALSLGLLPFSRFGPCGPSNLAAVVSFLLLLIGAPALFLSAALALILRLVRGRPSLEQMQEQTQEKILDEWCKRRTNQQPATWAEIHEFYGWLKVNRPSLLSASGTTIGWPEIQACLGRFASG